MADDRDVRIAAAALASSAVRVVHRLPNKTVWATIATLRATGQLGAARQLLDAIEQRDGATAKAQDERARIAFAQGDQGLAHQILTDRYQQRPSATAALAVARLHLEMGELEAAAAISDDLLAAHGDLVTVQQFAVEIARVKGDIERARTYLLGVLDHQPEHVGTLLGLAELAVDEGDSSTARAFLRRARATDAGIQTASQLVVAARIAEGIGEQDEAAALRAEAAGLRRGRLLETISQLQAEIDALPSVPFAGDDSGGSKPTGPAQSPARQRDAPGTKPRTAVRPPRDELPEVPERALQLLRDDFGHDSLRPGQATVIAHVLGGVDTLAVMPTGAGKSLTFQLPSMLDDGTTLVISPLIALMKDQVESLPPEVRVRTTLINSSLSSDEMRDRLDALRDRKYRLVYVAPERLRNHAFLRALREAGIRRMVVDEAHCISMWGHDFRPDYLFIPRALEELGQPPLLAITATVTPGMAEQIASGLGREMSLVRTSVFRPNLRYEVIHVEKREQKLQRVVDICREERGAGIVYVSSRRDADAIAGLLRDRGVSAIAYHAGLDAATRSRNQDQFMAGNVRVVVATVAFGMGVDKANVRFIIHVMAPRSLEAYAQESGRAGRDGQPSRCVLLLSPHDRTQLNGVARRDEMELADLRKVYALLRRQARGAWAIFDPAHLRPASIDTDDEPDARVALGVLEQAGLIRRHPDAPINYDLRRATLELTEDPVKPDTELWQLIETALPESWLSRGSCRIDTAALCDQIGMTPAELDRALHELPGVTIPEGQRGTCLAMLPVNGDAAATLQALLDRSRIEAQDRIAQVMSYANGLVCRHTALATHLGERLDPCGTSCDVCTGTVDHGDAQANARQPRIPLTANDVHAVLVALRTLPFPVGKTGLVRLLTGSIESKIRADRSPAFGALKAFSKSKVEALIEHLIQDGYILRDEHHEYRLLSLTPAGEEARAPDLVTYADVRRAPVTPAASANPASDLAAADHVLYERLTEWRRAKAIEEEVPPYVVAHNSMLRNLAIARPATKTALLAVPGFGETRVDRYGTELLAVIGDTGATGK